MSRDRRHEPSARELARRVRRCLSLDRLRARRFCAALLLIILALGAGCATVRQRPAIAVVQSRTSGARPSLAPFFVTVHVLLQVHEHPHEALRALEDKARIAACQERIVANALRLGERGVRGVVAEGIYSLGSLDKPQPVDSKQFAQTNKNSAAEIIAAHSELAVYGFELKPLNDFGISVVKQLGTSAVRARELGKDSSGVSKSSNDEEIDRLIQDESTRLNLWHAGLVPARSFFALQTALAVALARHENQVQLIIGRAHWSDLVYAIDRHDDVRLRLIPYPCE
jgi:hypothetical protein